MGIYGLIYIEGSELARPGKSDRWAADLNEVLRVGTKPPRDDEPDIHDMRTRCGQGCERVLLINKINYNFNGFNTILMGLFLLCTLLKLRMEKRLLAPAPCVSATCEW